MNCAKKLLLNVNNFTLLKLLTPKFMSKVGAMLSIVEQVFKDMYKLELPPEIKVHPIFHISLLMPFKKDTLWPDCKQVIRSPLDLIGGHLQHEVRRNHQVYKIQVKKIK